MSGSAQNEFDESCSSVAPHLPTREMPRQGILQGLLSCRAAASDRFFAPRLGEMDVTPCSGLKNIKSGQRVAVAGLVMVRRPGSAKGVMFTKMKAILPT
jgi:hypothetical protein